MDNLTFEQLPGAVSQMALKLERIERLLADNLTHQAPTPPETLLTVQEAASFLRLTVPTVYSKVSRGELPVMKRSKRLYFSLDELTDYLKEGRRMTYQEAEAKAAENFK